MPFDRPPLTQLRNDAAADLDAELDGIDARLRFSNLGIVTDVTAGLAEGMYGYLDWIAKQNNPFTATDEYLEGWAGLKGVTRKPASNAIGQATFPAANGAVVPTGSLINRSDGVVYVTSAEATAAGDHVVVQISSAAAGADTNAQAGTALFLGVGIAGVTAAGVATGPLTGGADGERDDQLRSRMLTRYAKPPQGGSIDDYGEWSLEVAGVTRCWVVPGGMGPGTIVLLFMKDDAQAAFGGFPQGTDGCASLETRDTPATGDQLALADYLFFKQPPTALIYAVAPIPNTVNLTIAGLNGASTAVKAQVAGAFAAALRAGGRPGGVTSILAIEAAIAAVAGTSGAVITGVTCSAGSVSPGSAGNIMSDTGALPVPGTITYP